MVMTNETLHTHGPSPKYACITQDELDSIKARLAELEEERRWREFSEEKPEHHQWILVFYPNHSQFTTGVELRRWDDGCKFDVEVQEVYDKWMPLPKFEEDK